jgi:polar amino acid transport system substrate-binding protein
MRKHVLGAALILASLALAACGGVTTPMAQGGEAPAASITDLGGNEIRVAVENAYPPFNLIGDNGEGEGWDYDFFRAACDRLNCEPVFVEAAWEGLFEAMSVGEYDVVGDGITLTLARSIKVDYSDPYVEYGQVILVRADDETLTSEEALVNSDATVGTQLGTTNEISAMKLVGEDRIVSFEQYDMPVVAMLAGDVDSVIIDEVAAVGFMRENPGELKIAFPVTTGEFLALVFPPESTLTVSFNWAMQEMFADGSMDQICEDWIMRPCSPQE